MSKVSKRIKRRTDLIVAKALYVISLFVGPSKTKGQAGDIGVCERLL